VLVAFSKGMLAVKLAVKLRSNKTLQFLTGGAGSCRLACIMAVKWWQWWW